MSLKEIYQRRSLKKGQKRNKRKRQLKNLGDIKNVGVIFERDSEQTASNMQKLAKFLNDQGIKVQVLAFVNLKKPTPELAAKKNLSLFYRKDLNWFGKPKSDEVDSFINQPFDLLIKADFSAVFALAWICTVSKTALVAGPNDQMKDVYDFIIETHNKDQNQYHQQLIHYLSIINQKTSLNQSNYAE